MTFLVREVDALASHVGELSRRTEPGTWKRLWLMPALLGVLAAIVAQEAVRVLLGLPRQAERAVGAFPVLAAPEHALTTFAVAVVVLLLAGVVVYRRSMKRAYAAGLDQ